MKRFLPLVLVACFVCHGMAEEANGLRVTVQKTLLERDKDRDAFYGWDKVNKALGLKVAAKNISLKELPEGSLEFKIIVKRWGHRNPELFESYVGTEKFPALAKSGETNLVVAKVPMGGWETTSGRKDYVDTVEGYEIVVRHADKETIRIKSTAGFDKLAAKAKPGRLPQ
jgi:hypothetical protein